MPRGFASGPNEARAVQTTGIGLPPRAQDRLITNQGKRSARGEGPVGRVVPGLARLPVDKGEHLVERSAGNGVLLQTKEPRSRLVCKEHAALSIGRYHAFRQARQHVLKGLLRGADNFLRLYRGLQARNRGGRGGDHCIGQGASEAHHTRERPLPRHRARDAQERRDGAPVLGPKVDNPCER